MKKIILTSFVIIGLLSLAFNIAYLTDTDCHKTKPVNYDQKRIEGESALAAYLKDHLKLNPKDVALVLEIINQIPVDIEKFVKPRADAYSKKYGSSVSSYIYQAEDYIFLGKTRLEARRKMSELIGQKNWDELFDHIQRFNQIQNSSGPVFQFEI